MIIKETFFTWVCIYICDFVLLFSRQMNLYNVTNRNRMRTFSIFISMFTWELIIYLDIKLKQLNQRKVNLDMTVFRFGQTFEKIIKYQRTEKIVRKEILSTIEMHRWNFILTYDVFKLWIFISLSLRIHFIYRII